MRFCVVVGLVGVLAGCPSTTHRPLADSPTTCDEAALGRSYLGCEFWPTAVANGVLQAFDFAVVVANPSGFPADVEISGPGDTRVRATVESGTLAKLYLPWVDALNPPGATCETSPELVRSFDGPNAAFHLTSTRPIAAYQFNPLQYRAANLHQPEANALCTASCDGIATCFSVSNDAALLLPQHALGTSYRIAALERGVGNYIALTATENDTEIDVQLAARGKTLAGWTRTRVPAIDLAGAGHLTMQAGDVIELVGNTYDSALVDLSGALVSSTRPLQVISGDSCVRIPAKYPNTCDHIETTQLPTAALGRRYVVPSVTGPNGTPVGQVVRLYAHHDDTRFTFDPPRSDVAPLAAGQWIDLGIVNKSFYVEANEDFAVSTFQLSAPRVDWTHEPSDQRGDPSQSMAIPMERFRKSYVFVAPDDYDNGFADVIVPAGTTSLVLDDVAIADVPETIGGCGYGVLHLPLAMTSGGMHTLVADQPIGVQVVGYGLYTSYQFPAGLDL